MVEPVLLKGLGNCPGHGFKVLYSIFCKRVKRHNTAVYRRRYSLCTFCIILRLDKDGAHMSGPGLFDESGYGAWTGLSTIDFYCVLLQSIGARKITECRVVGEKNPAAVRLQQG